jgi:hypothetical protein
MEITSSVARRISQFAWVMAAAGTVIGQVHALARAQAHPDDFVESPLGRAWGEPAIRALRPLLDWSDPYTVYVTYGKIWLPVCLAFTAAAYLVYRRRRPKGAERRLWQVSLVAYAVMTLSVFGDYFTPWMDQMFILGIGAMLIIGVGGIALGIMMLRNGFRPRITPILLMIFIPFMFAVTEVTSLGSALLPLMWGWAVAATPSYPVSVRQQQTPPFVLGDGVRAAQLVGVRVHRSPLTTRSRGRRRCRPGVWLCRADSQAAYGGWGKSGEGGFVGSAGCSSFPTPSTRQGSAGAVKVTRLPSRTNASGRPPRPRGDMEHTVIRGAGSWPSQMRTHVA